MKKLKYFFLLPQIIFTLLTVNAQYTLKQTFSSLPAFSNPIELVHAYDGTNRLFVVQQRGIVYVFNNSPTVNLRRTFINLAGKVSQSGSETGLLGLAFHPDYENNRYFYVNYTFDSATALWSRISRFTASISNPDTALINTELIFMTLSQPFSNHNGGKVAFGNDGYLYISFGDGGSGGDPGNRAQNKAELLGKILRIDVDTPSPGSSYSIPPTNPFYGNTQGWKEEIYAYGLRNMWKFNFDYLTNTLWGGDVGQNAFEEVDIIENGKNYGWNKMEGLHCYPTNSCDTTGMGFTRPIWEYAQGPFGGSVTGGFVYRGALLPELYGKYIYADYIDGTIWALTYDGINPATNEFLFDTTFLISSFGVDQNNEIYVCRYSSTGRIYTISNTNVITLNLKVSIEGFYNTIINALNKRDTVSVYLHSSVSPNNIVDSAKAVVDSLTLRGLFIFNNAPSGTYYIKVKHRNGLETWSKAGGEFLTQGSVINYDFTTSSSQAFGNNLTLKGGIYHIYSGDVIKDGFINVLDVGLVYNDAQNSVSGPVDTDLTGDNFVDVIDISTAYNNSAYAVSVMRP